MPVEILSKPDHVCLVHADVDAARGETFRAGRKHLFNEGVRLFLSRKENVPCIGAVMILRPARHSAQVRKRLNAGDKLQPACLCRGVELFEICFGIPSAQIAETGLSLDLVRVLRVQLHIVVAHLCKQ